MGRTTLKLLENIALVQFFLYEAKDLETGINTAFLGPNGTGKSALLDAIQVVMLAADGNRTHFNAASEGKKRSRTLRDYCLGSYIPGGSSYARTSANTYVDLVFRDAKTGVPFTAGVSLSAHIDDPKAEVNGLYILPGVAMTAKHHLQTEGQRETVMPWRAFQHMATDLCRLEAKTVPVFTQNRDDFVRRLLIDHLAGPGDKPNSQSLRAAFARSLKLNEDITDLSETLRQHLIEPMPTGVKEFRARLDEVRDLRDLITRLKERIDRATEVADKYGVVKRERTSDANLAVLKHTYSTERLGETLDSAEAEIEKLTEEIERAKLELVRSEAESTLAIEARDRVIAELNRDPDFRKQAGHAENLKQLESTLGQRQAQLRLQFLAMLAALSTATDLPDMEAHRSAFEGAASQVRDLERIHDDDKVPPAVAIQATLRSMAQAYDVVRRAVAEAEAEHKLATEKRREAMIARERASRGLTSLHQSTMQLMGVLSDAGIDVTPVCDLVTVSDPNWQPAIESWLGRHIEALLVPAEKELDAIAIYRSKAATGIYGVKLALPSRTREWRAMGNEQYAAELIQGKSTEAVQYLQGELGRTVLAESNEQLRAGAKAISKEGMASSGGGIERRRLPGAGELRLGRTDSSATRQRAEQDFQVVEERLRITTTTVDRLLAGQQKLAPFADAAALQGTLESQFLAAAQTAGATANLRSALESTQTDSLAGLQARKAAADSDAVNAREKELQWTREVTRLGEKLTHTNTQVAGLQQQLEVESLRERECRQNTLYNANEVERHRARLDERHRENWAQKLSSLDRALQQARSAADNADRDAWYLFANYTRDYNLQNIDVSSGDWLRAFEFILAERQRLQDLELAEQEEKAEEAYQAAVKVFRTDVAQTLLTGFDRIQEQIDGLTSVLKSAPAFSNNERYEFKHKVVDEHRSLYDFLRRVRTQGSSEDDLFGGSGDIPDEFRMLVEGDSSSPLLHETSPLNDHRRFFSYDIEVFQDGTSVGWLSKRFGPASGGEHRTPVYLIFGAALAAAYGKSKGSTAGGGIMLLDEAFEKMDPQNVRATVQYLNALGLQLIMAGPESDQAKLSSFLSIYYDMSRFGSRNVQFKKNVVLDGARDLLQSDNFFVNPNLLQQEIDRLTEADNVTG